MKPGISEEDRRCASSWTITVLKSKQGSYNVSSDVTNAVDEDLDADSTALVKRARFGYLSVSPCLSRTN